MAHLYVAAKFLNSAEKSRTVIQVAQLFTGHAEESMLKAVAIVCPEFHGSLDWAQFSLA